MGKKYYLTAILLISFTQIYAQTGSSITGKISDKKTGEGIAGATIIIEGTNLGTLTDADGQFLLTDISDTKQKMKISAIPYKTMEVEIEVKSNEIINLNFSLEEDNPIELSSVSVIGFRKMNSEISMLNLQKNALNVVSGISSQQIAKTQDKDASEVMKRIPGISILDNRYIIARGLSQRYNNAWINNNAVPSSEADTRSFSFDMIPGGQIENILIVKSPVPELPADFTGGFVKISTKNMPTENSIQISYGTNFNTTTHFQNFKAAKGSPTDFLGFDNGFRSMRSVVPKERMNNQNADLVTNVSKNGFNNNWGIRTYTPIGDQRFSFSLILNNVPKRLIN
ncbi:MAG: TonB-dependent receptor [Paludibacter sp.]|nr:TonB-dependent receptor [Paludibacter sp.]